MSKNNINTEASAENDCYLPDFCQGETVLRLIMVLLLVAVVIALSNFALIRVWFVEFAMMTLLIQWIGLSSASMLCLLRRYSSRSDVAGVTASALMAVAVVTALLSALVLWADQQLQLGYFVDSSITEVLSRHLAIALILTGLALRYFYVQHHHRMMLRAEARARLQALQARIRPHFLFNSLNTIASLTHDAPDRAEHAIENLSELFRASLKADQNITLAQEIDFTQQYVELEQLRLDARLKVDWHIDAATETLQLPALTLQPLVENAIYHGIEPIPGGGVVTIDIQQNPGLKIRISNPLNPKQRQSHERGNRMALENIRERLELAFGSSASIDHVAGNDLYTVEIAIS